MKQIVFLAVAFIYGVLGLAHGGVVRVVTNVAFGQGWMFLDSDGNCKVVTPAHVIKLADGRIAANIIIKDAKNREFSLNAPQILSDDPDIAVLQVKGANNPLLCGDGRVSAIGIARRIKTAPVVRIETTGNSEIIRVPVQWRAVRADLNEGAVFSVQPTNSNDHIKRGWSGSAVLDDEGLLGILVEVSEEYNEAIAVRTDLIRGLIDAAPPISRIGSNIKNTDSVSIIVQVGATLDLQSGADQVIRNDGTGWKVAPVQKRIVMVMVYENPIRLHGVAMSFASATNFVEGMEVSSSTSMTDRQWTSLNYCRIPQGLHSVTCPFIDSTARLLKISFATSTDEPIVISGIKTVP
jgi:hypothetical protein